MVTGTRMVSGEVVKSSQIQEDEDRATCSCKREVNGDTKVSGFSIKKSELSFTGRGTATGEATFRYCGRLNSGPFTDDHILIPGICEYVTWRGKRDLANEKLRSWDGKVMLLLLSRFSRVRLCATPKTEAHQALPSLGFSRQEHWSGLPFPSPMHESEKWKWSRSVVSDS